MPAAIAQRAPAQSIAPASRLGTIKKGRVALPHRFVFYGDNGVGKSTLAAHAPDPIWLDIEDGSNELDVSRYPFTTEPGGHVPRSYAEVKAAIADLTANPHGYKTLVADTLDRLESLIWQSVVERYSGKPGALNKSGKQFTSIEEFGFGKGFQLALDEWRAFCESLDNLRKRRGMTIILIGHQQIRTYKNPIDDDYDRIQLRAHDKAAGFLKEWADVVGYCCFEEVTDKLDEDSRARGKSTGVRLIRLERSAAYDAKTRLTLPPQIEMDAVDPWAPFGKAVAQSESMTVEDLKAAIAVEVERIGDEDMGKKVSAAVSVAAAKEDTNELHRYLQGLKRRPSAQPAT